MKSIVCLVLMLFNKLFFFLFRKFVGLSIGVIVLFKFIILCIIGIILGDEIFVMKDVDFIVI